MKVVFLDIDGVLNSPSTPNPRKLPYIVDKKLLKRLLRVMRACRAKIVLTSSWRVDPIGLYAAKQWGIPFVDVCPDLPDRSRVGGAHCTAENHDACLQSFAVRRCERWDIISSSLWIALAPQGGIIDLMDYRLECNLNLQMCGSCAFR